MAAPHGKQSLANVLQKAANFFPIAVGLLREAAGPSATSATCSADQSEVPIRLFATQPVAKAISTAGGISFEALDHGVMLRTCQGVFAAGEMLDWEAQTGGYLLQAWFATGIAAAESALVWLKIKTGSPESSAATDR